MGHTTRFCRVKVQEDSDRRNKGSFLYVIEMGNKSLCNDFEKEIEESSSSEECEYARVEDAKSKKKNLRVYAVIVKGEI